MNQGIQNVCIALAILYWKMILNQGIQNVCIALAILYWKMILNQNKVASVWHNHYSAYMNPDDVQNHNFIQDVDGEAEHWFNIYLSNVYVSIPLHPLSTDTIEFKSEYTTEELSEIQQIVQINYDNIGNYTNSKDRKVKQGKLLLVSLLEVRYLNQPHSISQLDRTFATCMISHQIGISVCFWRSVGNCR